MTDRTDVADPETGAPEADRGPGGQGPMDAVAQVARAVLYEGYLLWPYRASALKNTRRWTLGGVYPPACAATGDSSLMRTQVLVEAEPGDTVDVRLCYLHTVTLEVGRLDGDELVPVPELTVGGRRHRPREEATERRTAVTGLDLHGLTRRPVVRDITVPAGRDVEWLTGPDGRRAGALTRSWRELRGRMEIRAERLAAPAGRGALLRLTVTVENLSDWPGGGRSEAMRYTFASAHTILHAPDALFVSLTDPPEALRAHAEACENVGAWPVLAGEEGTRHTVLSSPIILYDHPKVAPESPGDLFDATEIDQLLTHSILALTDEEWQEIRDGDPKGAEILERCVALPPERLMRLYGATREFRPLPEEAR
ncbi:MAG: hypothetical protein DIU60_010020 [Actinomycetes bacterium]